jgi:hypothetical protein
MMPYSPNHSVTKKSSLEVNLATKNRLARAPASPPSLKRTVSTQSVPTVYADGIGQVGFGPAVSRIELYVERLGSSHEPTLSVVMPTHALVTFAKQFIDQFEKLGTAEKMRAELDRILTTNL